MGTAHQKFYDLEVWKKSRALKNEIWVVVKTFPSAEKYHLSSQLIRSTRSITATLAEGHGRFTIKDQLHFCIIARGSLSETFNHLIDAYDCSYISQDQLNYFKFFIEEITKFLNGYISYLRKNTANISKLST
ncbi:MAG: four helix bundle protein [Ferruginibacter sp.]